MPDVPMSIDELAGLYADLRRAGMTPPEVLDRSPLTLGESLDAPMERANPSVLPWETSTYHLSWRQGGRHFTGTVTQYLYHPDSVEGFRWQAAAFGPGGSRMEPSWHESAQDARAAVEEHILAHVDTGLSEEPE